MYAHRATPGIHLLLIHVCNYFFNLYLDAPISRMRPHTHNLNAKYVECAHDVIGHPQELSNLIVQASVCAPGKYVHKTKPYV